MGTEHRSILGDDIPGPRGSSYFGPVLLHRSATLDLRSGANPAPRGDIGPTPGGEGLPSPAAQDLRACLSEGKRWTREGLSVLLLPVPPAPAAVPLTRLRTGASVPRRAGDQVSTQMMGCPAIAQDHGLCSFAAVPQCVTQYLAHGSCTVNC